MRIKPFYFLLLVLLLFSCRSTPPPPMDTLLDYDRTKFAPKDGRLFYAVKGGSTTKVKAALDDSPDINVADYLGQTAFMWACRNGNLEIINALLDYNEKGRNKRLNIRAISSEKYPYLNYNALFCYIMTRNIIPSSQDAQVTLNRIINLDKKILDMTDRYEETVIHKLVRSNNNYFEVIARNMDASKKKDMFNRKSIYGQSPLMLAVGYGNNRWIIDALVNSGTVIEDITNDDLLVYAFDQGNRDVRIFTSLLQGKMKYGKRGKNEQFEKAFAECSKVPSASTSKKLSPFDEVYKRYLDVKDITNAKDIEYDEYSNEMTDIFKMLEIKLETPQQKQNFFDKLEEFREALYKRENVGGKEKTLLEMAIEYQDNDVFESIMELKNIKMDDLLLPGGPGTGDYLTLAMLRRKPAIMHYLLKKYPDPDANRRNLMNAADSKIMGEERRTRFGEVDLVEPLHLFCTDSTAKKDSDWWELLRKMAHFYQTRYKEENYRRDLLSELAKNKRFDIYEYFMNHADYGIYFRQVNELRVDKPYDEPVIKILLDNNKMELVENYIKFNGGQLNDENRQALLKSGNKELLDIYNGLNSPQKSVQERGRESNDKK